MLSSILKINVALSLAVFLVQSAYPQLPQNPDWYTSNTAENGLGVGFVNGDNYRDLVTTQAAGSNSGGCWFNFAPTEPGEFGLGITGLSGGMDAKFGQLRLNQPEDLAISDINAGIPPTGEIQIYQNNNDGSLALQQVLSTYLVRRICWGNINGDLWDDLIASGYDQNPNFAYIYTNNFGTLVEPQAGIDLGSGIWKVELVDLDRIWYYTTDELVISSYNQIKIFDNDGAGSFYPDPVQTINAGPGNVYDFALADLNNDDYNDLVAVSLS